MKFRKLLLFIIISIFCFSFQNVFAKEEIKLYFFHGDGCPHCAEEEKFLEKIEKKYSNVKVIRYEVWNNKSNAMLMKRVGNKYDITTNSVPLTVISGTAVSGYAESVGVKIERIIKYYDKNKEENIDYVSKIKSGTYNGDKIRDSFDEYDKKSDQDTKIDIPIFGEVNLKNFSLPTASILIGLVDGFNPCAMWVLVYLISIAITLKDRKKLIIFLRSQ